MEFLTVLAYLFTLLLVAFILVCIVIYITSETYPTIIEYEKEKTFLDASNPSLKHQFPSIEEPASVDLTIVVPSYNEEERLPLMLEECLQYLEDRQKTVRSFTYEVIIVDDGSTDATTKVGLETSRKYGSDKVRVLTLHKNRGKGGAVRLGMLRGRGRLLLFADADGATKFVDVEKLENALKTMVKDPENDHAIVIGSRAHLEKDSIAERSLFRTILMVGFHILVWLFCVRGVRDTQCGFKLFTRAATRVGFFSLHVERWAFDVELLYIAQKCRIPISEIAVNWTEIPGSKVTPLLAAMEMGRDLVLIWLRYTIGAWKMARNRTSSKLD